MLIKSIASSVSVTLGILRTTVQLTSTNANLRLAFTVRNFVAENFVNLRDIDNEKVRCLGFKVSL